MALQGAVYGTTVYLRSEWGARDATAMVRIPSPAHNTAHYAGDTDWDQPGVDRTSPERFRLTTDHERCAAIMRAHQAFHMDSRGWSDYAYSGSACPHGRAFLGRGRGVRTAANGTTLGNDTSYAIQYLGAGADDPLTDEAKRAFVDLAFMLDRGIPLDRGHRDWKPTSCPGDIVYGWRLAGFPRPEISAPEEVDLQADERLWLAEIHQATRSDWGVSLTWQTRAWIQDTVSAIVKGQTPPPVPVDVDEAAIVAGVLAQLTPAAIAAAIPDGLAADVADELAQRLGNG